MITVPLHFKTYGSGYPVVILHGLFGMLDNWSTFGKSMAERYMIYLVDQRDHGKSPHTDKFDYPHLAADLDGFLEDQWLHKTHFIGHSMGGKTLLEFAKHHQDKVDKMVIVDMGIKQYLGGHESVIAALNAVDMTALTSRSEVEEQLSNYLTDDQDTVLFLMKNLQRNKAGGYQWKMNLPLLTSSYNNILTEIQFEESIEVPICFIRGEHSNYVLDEDMPAILEVFPKAEFVTIPNAGHWVHSAQPQLLFKAVVEFFQR